jgi:hypothetical protein
MPLPGDVFIYIGGTLLFISITNNFVEFLKYIFHARYTNEIHLWIQNGERGNDFATNFWLTRDVIIMYFFVRLKILTINFA